MANLKEAIIKYRTRKYNVKFKLISISNYDWCEAYLPHQSDRENIQIKDNLKSQHIRIIITHWAMAGSKLLAGKFALGNPI